MFNEDEIGILKMALAEAITVQLDLAKFYNESPDDPTYKDLIDQYKSLREKLGAE